MTEMLQIALRALVRLSPSEQDEIAARLIIEIARAEQPHRRPVAA